MFFPSKMSYFNQRQGFKTALSAITLPNLPLSASPVRFPHANKTWFEFDYGCAVFTKRQERLCSYIISIGFGPNVK